MKLRLKKMRVVLYFKTRKPCVHLLQQIYFLDGVQEFLKAGVTCSPATEEKNYDE